jgi:hypothetical protein
MEQLTLEEVVVEDLLDLNNTCRIAGGSGIVIIRYKFQ